MKHTCIDTSRHITSQYNMSRSKKVRISPDYFGEALRILDHDMTVTPQREHVAVLWGLVVGLTRRLTQALVECQNERSRNSPYQEGR